MENQNLEVHASFFWGLTKGLHSMRALVYPSVLGILLSIAGHEGCQDVPSFVAGQPWISLAREWNAILLSMV